MRSLKPIMIICLACSVQFSLAQSGTDHYKRQWSRIDSLLDIAGLPMDAMKLVQTVQQRAVREQKKAELLRCLLYKIQIRNMREEDASQENIRTLELIPTAGDPVLHSVRQLYLALLYQYYLYSHATQAIPPERDRKDTVISTWTTADFHQKIRFLFLSSLQNKKALQNSKLEQWQSLLDTNRSARRLRPTLYDLLSAQALDYFESAVTDPTQIPTSFELSEEFLKEADSFSRIHLNPADSGAALFQSVRIYQEWLTFHKKAKNEEAYGDIDLNRIRFVYAFATTEKKDSLYLAALENILRTNRKGPIADEAGFMLADWYASNASRPGTPAKNFLQKARSLCEEVILRGEPTQGKANCMALKETLTQKTMRFLAEKVNLPKEPFRLLVTYQNTEKIYLRIIGMQPQEITNLRYANTWEEEYWKTWTEHTPLREWSVPLPEADDMTEHKTELKVDALPIGSYMLLASIDSTFRTTENKLAMQVIHASSIGWIQSANDLYVVDRRSGQPKEKATVILREETFRYEIGKPELVSEVKYVTDSNGRIQLDSPFTNYNEKSIEVFHGEDHLSLENNRVALYYNYPATSIKLKAVSGTLFSDRSIYRPEQMIFFKGLITGKINEDNPLPESDFSTTVYLTDPNGRRIDSALMTTNAFGSYSGSFTLPRNNLLGIYTLRDSKSYAYAQFRVEAYKRPRFEVRFGIPARSYRPGDSVIIQGTAEAYTGTALSNAKVKYVVRRRQHLRIFYKDRFPSSGISKQSNTSQLIAFGNTQTDRDGLFQVDFKAIPDPGYLYEKDEIILYEIQADITDIQGETQSASWLLPVSRNPIRIEIDAPETLEGDGLEKVKIYTRNLYEMHVPCMLRVRLVKLASPLLPVRNRLWDKPDQFIYDPATFKRWFPLDEYASETEPDTWPEQTEVLTSSDSSRTSGEIRWNSKLPGNGYYRLYVECIGVNGDRISAQRSLKQEGGPLYFASIRTDHSVLEPGDTLRYSMLSNMDSVWLLSVTGKIGTSESISGYTSLRSDKKEMLIRESDRGGISLTAGFYLHNRFYVDQRKIEVPFSNKELSIQYSSFRDKTLPGASELWKIRIKNKENKPVKAEILSTLYDASLDQFTIHRWFKPSLWIKQPVQNPMESDLLRHPPYPISVDFAKRKFSFVDKRYETFIPVAGRTSTETLMGNMPRTMVDNGENIRSATAKIVSFDKPETTMIPSALQKERNSAAASKGQQAVSIRKDFKETAFFIPHSVTDSNGEVVIAFRMPDALTRWKWMTLAHTQDLSLGYDEKMIVTDKPLMVQANPPRFFREGDRIDYPVKISNTTDKELTGQVQLLVIDPETGESMDGWFQNFFPNQYFTVPPRESVAVSFSIEIPYRFNKPVLARVVARTEEYSDGEESILPVLSDRIMVTESMPIPFNGYKDVHISWEKLKKADSSNSLNHHALTFECTSNPFWYAVQNLPYLAMNPGESADQAFLRFYANSLSEWVLRKVPKLKEALQKWSVQDSLQLPSPFDRNESITGTLLEETPWVMESHSARSLQNKMIGYYKNENIREQLLVSGEQLGNFQNSDGSFSWFNGGPPNVAITLQILTGIVRLRHLHIIDPESSATDQLIRKGLAYMDRWMGEQYKKTKLNAGGPADRQIIHYLYLRSFLPEFPMADSLRKPFSFYYDNVCKNWNRYNKMLQGMIALSCYRNRDITTSGRIIASLRQNALFSDEMGMYWKEFNSPGHYWDEEPIRSHALLMDAFYEITKDASMENKLRTWLIRQKETQHWSTSAGTAEACRTLLRDTGILLQEATDLTVKFGSNVIRPKTTEAGTGFTRITIPGNRVTSSMAEVDIHLNDRRDTAAPTPWGALYWQYMEDLDKVSPASGPLSIRKKLFIERTSDQGLVLDPLAEGSTVHIGEKIIVQLEVRTDRNLEFVHLKDMRAAALEPVQVTSGYHWTKGTLFYQANKDAAMHFYFDLLPKGTHVFTYTMYAQQKGTFQNGIAHVQCLYAPVFSSHSASLRFHAE